MPSGYALRVASPLVLVLVALVSASAFATSQAHTGSSQAPPDKAARAIARSVESGLIGAISMPATPVDPESDRFPLSNSGDSEEDGTGDPVEVFAMVGFWLLLLGEGRLLLALYNGPTKLSSICSSILERPG